MPESDVEMEEVDEVQPEREMNLGEFSRDDMNVHNGQNKFDDSNSVEGDKKLRKHWHCAAARNTALLTIISECVMKSTSSLMHCIQKCVIIISIILQRANEQCNYLQSILGIFYHSTWSQRRSLRLLLMQAYLLASHRFTMPSQACPRMLPSKSKKRCGHSPLHLLMTILISILSQHN